jgi:hypothetical protein
MISSCFWSLFIPRIDISFNLEMVLCGRSFSRPRVTGLQLNSNRVLISDATLGCKADRTLGFFFFFDTASHQLFIHFTVS